MTTDSKFPGLPMDQVKPFGVGPIRSTTTTNEIQMLQPVVIMIRGHRVEMEASVFPLFMRGGAPSTGAAMAHGTVEECERWIAARTEHVELVGKVREYPDHGEMLRQLWPLTKGRDVPGSCLWRPPEERIAALADARKAEACLRGQAIENLDAALSACRHAQDMVRAGLAADAMTLERLQRESSSAVSRHAAAATRIADLEE